MILILNENLINQRYKSYIFVNNPNTESNIQILLNKSYKHETPFFSIVIPICNQENIIQQNLQSILTNTSDKLYEIILILDSCSDSPILSSSRYYYSVYLNSYSSSTATT